MGRLAPRARGVVIPEPSGYRAPVLAAPINLVVLALVLAMVGIAGLWYRRGRRHLEQLKGSVQVLGAMARDLPAGHPIRVRIESQTVAELSLEELVRLVRDEARGPAAQGLLDLQIRAGWVERFAQFAVHLGILGTVLALMLVDGTDMGSFRARLPLALGTTFFGLIGALLLGAIGGAVDGVLESARVRLRTALLDSDGG